MVAKRPVEPLPAADPLLTELAREALDLAGRVSSRLGQRQQPAIRPVEAERDRG